MQQQESALQQACVRWFRLAHPGLALNLFAVPNGGRRDLVTGARLKAEGAVAGVADLLLLRASGPWHGMAIEMKTAKGRQSPSQAQWQLAAEREGYRYAVCRSFDDFRREVEAYLGGG